MSYSSGPWAHPPQKSPRKSRAPLILLALAGVTLATLARVAVEVLT